MTLVDERMEAAAPARPAPSAVRDQAVVLAGQIGAGVGTMAFSLVMARLLAPGTYAQLASFLALYLVLGLPATAVTAAAAVAPGRLARIGPILLFGGFGVGAALAVGSPWLGPLLRLPIPLVVILGLSGPALGTVALERGCLYGWRLHGRLIASLLAEPVVRLGLGVVMALMAGVAGAAIGVALGGYAALDIARRHRRVIGAHSARRLDEATLDPGTSRNAAWTAVAFMALVVVQNQDLLIANRVLPPGVAGQFAVLSTLGGMAAFATFTVPLVLLPRTSAGRGGLAPALSLTALIGAGAVGISAVAATPVVVALFGSRYAAVGAILVWYMAAMALLGVVRVLVAYRCATGAGPSSVAAVLLAAVVQATLIARYGHDIRSVALSTAVSIGGLGVALGMAELGRTPAVRLRVAGARSALSQPVGVAARRGHQCVSGPHAVRGHDPQPAHHRRAPAAVLRGAVGDGQVVRIGRAGGTPPLHRGGHPRHPHAVPART
jgi:O-antigen/teichoic acid export membrane protein